MNLDMTPFQLGYDQAVTDMRQYGLWFAVVVLNGMTLDNQFHAGYGVALDTYVMIASRNMDEATDWSDDARHINDVF